MRVAGFLGLAMLLSGCMLGGPPTFDPFALSPTSEKAEDTETFGWLRLGDQMRLYPTRGTARKQDQGTCIAVRPLSLAGVVSENYDGRPMVVTGRIARDVGTTCTSGLVIVASDISAP